MRAPKRSFVIPKVLLAGFRDPSLRQPLRRDQPVAAAWAPHAQSSSDQRRRLRHGDVQPPAATTRLRDDVGAATADQCAERTPRAHRSRAGSIACGGLLRGDGFPVDWTADDGATWTHLVAPSPPRCSAVRRRRCGLARSPRCEVVTEPPSCRSSSPFGPTTSARPGDRSSCRGSTGSGAFVAGSVVTTDGRLLSLLNNFSRRSDQPPLGRPPRSVRERRIRLVVVLGAWSRASHRR